MKEHQPVEDTNTEKVSERLANNDKEQQPASETISKKQQNQPVTENIDKEQQNQSVLKANDKVHQQHEPVSKSSDPGRQQGSDTLLPQTNTAQDKRLAVLKRPRRDSGVYPPNWKTILSSSDPQSPALTGIPEVSL